MIVDQQRTYELSCMYIEQRLADAAHERLLREVERARGPRPALTARFGALLVRTGRRLEALGGAPQPARPARSLNLPRYSV